MDIKQQVGQRIKELRKQKGWSQEEAANEIGMERSFLGNIEQGKKNISMETLEKICKGFDISLRDFFSNEPMQIQSSRPAAVYSNKSFHNQTTID